MVSEVRNARNVVVRAPNALGDFVMATPCFKRLAAHYGPENLTLVCLPSCAKLLEGNEWFREIIVFDRKGKHSGRKGRTEFHRSMRARKFDLGFILPNSLGSAWLFLRGGVRQRVGYYKEGRKILLHAGRARDTDAKGAFIPKYTGQYFMDLLDSTGVPDGPLVPELPVTNDEAARADEFLTTHDLTSDLVIIAPGAAFGPSKLWPSERFAAVATALRNDGASVLISAAPNEQATVDALQNASDQPFATNEGLDMGAWKALFARASLVLCNDTGPRHLAVAFQKPVVTLMGPNDPRYTDFPEFEQGEVIRETVDCSPYPYPCLRKECPIDHRCMNEISVDRVLASCRKWLAG